MMPLPWVAFAVVVTFVVAHYVGLSQARGYWTARYEQLLQHDRFLQESLDVLQKRRPERFVPDEESGGD